MTRPSQRVPSLRLWLQSSSLLAVMAGYSVLLLIHQKAAEWQRYQSFHRAAEQEVSALARRAKSAEGLKALLLNNEGLPGLTISIAAKGTELDQRKPSLIDDGRSQWLVGTAEVDLVDGSRVELMVTQDVTPSVGQERLGFLLLVIAAGVSSLITSGLLRLVMRRGLVQPLQEFSYELASFNAPPNPNDLIALEQQPRELQPIAEAFNALQGRLVQSWDRERAFADGVAHELRTPITLISGHSQRLLREPTLPEQIDALRLIWRESERMRSLVSDLLDVARCDSGRLSLSRTSIVVEDALLELFERLESKASGRLFLDLTQNLNEPSAVVRGDPDRLQQCLTALVDNALLYSKGMIKLSWSKAADGAVRLHVRDEGPGVEEQEREQIFERFVRGSAGLNSTQRGSGIGLSMVKLLMEAMGGVAAVAEAPGGGADFQLQLPVITTLDPQA